MKWVSDQIESYELSNKLNLGSIRLLIGVETAKGIMNLKEIAEADKRLEAIIFGGEDFAASVGAVRTKSTIELLYARQAVVTACAANDLQAIDIVFIDFKDNEGLHLEAEQGAGFGFSGKQIIHPNQVIPVQEAFTPSYEAIEYAKRIVESFESSQKEGKGAYALDGKMIDMPLLKNAQKVLERSKAAGKTTCSQSSMVSYPPCRGARAISRAGLPRVNWVLIALCFTATCWVCSRCLLSMLFIKKSFPPHHP